MKEWISLNMTPGIGPRKATQLLERFGSPERVFNALRSELEELRLPPETVQSILRKQFHKKAETEVETVRRIGGDVLILDDGIYPQYLREIHDPPITLYVTGDWRTCLEAPSVAVIGSRRCTTYGRNSAAMLAQDLAERGVCIVSGFARGIDTSAHKGAIRGGGKTIAVMGTGIDDVYPAENRKLADSILESGGAIVSQFPLGTPPLRDNFPYRNRIISGLSLGVLVVEASERSGSLITARLAMEQDRELMAVPGNITSRNSFGTNYLLKSGAKLVQHWQDVVTELPEEIAGTILPEGDESTSEGSRSRVPAGLTDNERKVYKLLKPDEHLHKDELLERSGLSFGELNASIVGLDLKDHILLLPGDNYAKRR
ncbi:MAG: DNA-protecting protein DprA [Acidobacteria bacterium]|nr:MAG: DNA-protecting protein DprA [Acidobacteriota bacterium]REJ99202.1 MAG: DNA-protecting protein DprA [Acidobacteriota bacterium]REK16077.1 MAG: DNA-protecting protein DprA [Acidobacteriota bacterium]REK43758.1 MAG: DNA-protecting protein DprA [Acidobacteriota bacterium]